jgi:hypothetical protein
VPFTFNEAASAAVGWYLSPVINLPSGAQINGLRLRWVKSGTLSVRIDDVKLQGTLAGGPSYSFTPASLSGMSGSFGSPGTPVSTTISGSLLTPASGSITVNAPANF